MATKKQLCTALARAVVTLDANGAAFTPATGTNYAAGDSVGGLLTFTNALSTPGGSALVTQIEIIEVASATVLKFGLDLLFLGNSGYSIADNAPFVPSTAGLLTANHLCGHSVNVASTDYYTIAGTTTYAVAQKTDKDFGSLRVFNSAMMDAGTTASQNIYAYLLWSGAGNKYASGATLTVRVTFEQD